MTTSTTYSQDSARPRYATPRDPDRPTFGPAVARIAAALRRPLLPWQADVADVAGEVGNPDPETGNARLRYPVVVLIVPRRAGKTVLTLSTHLQRLTIAHGRRGFYTAQTRNDAATTWRDDWVPAVQASPLRRLITVRNSNGSEAMTLGSGRFRLFAPTANAIHGRDADDVTIDEAWAFDLGRGVDLEAAIRPAQLTRSLAQLTICSAGGTDASTWLAAWRALGQAGPDGVAYFEWSADPTVDDLDDPQTWRRVHPALGHTFGIDALAGDRATMPRLEWERAYLGVWTSARGADPVIPAASWDACAADVWQAGAPVSLGLAVAPDGAAASIGAAWRDAAGHTWVEVVDRREGTAWVVDRAAKLSRSHRARIVVDRHGPAAPLVDDLRRARVPVDVVTTDDYAAACAALLLDVLEGRLRHHAQPVLTTAAATAGRRPLGERWAWSRASGEISALEAVTFAAADARKRRTLAPAIS